MIQKQNIPDLSQDFSHGGVIQDKHKRRQMRSKQEISNQNSYFSSDKWVYHWQEELSLESLNNLYTVLIELWLPGKYDAN